MNRTESGYVLLVGLLLLTLAAGIAFWGWNTTQLFYKISSNYHKKVMAKAAAYAALSLAEHRIRKILAAENYWKPLKNTMGVYSGNKILPATNQLEVPYPAQNWNDQNSQKVENGGRFFAVYFGDTDFKVFYFKIVTIGWSEHNESYQVLSAFYRFEKKQDGGVESARNAIYVF